MKRLLFHQEWLLPLTFLIHLWVLGSNNHEVKLTVKIHLFSNAIDINLQFDICN